MPPPPATGPDGSAHGATVRPLEPGDRGRVVELHQAAFPPEVAFHDLVLHKLFVHPQAVNLVAELQGEVVAFASAIHGSRDPARLFTLHVADEARGRGLAQELLASIEQRLAARGAGALEIHVHVGNHAARRLYEKAGYRLEREDPERYPLMDPPTGLVLRKELEGAGR